MRVGTEGFRITCYWCWDRSQVHNPHLPVLTLHGLTRVPSAPWPKSPPLCCPSAGELQAPEGVVEVNQACSSALPGADGEEGIYSYLQGSSHKGVPDPHCAAQITEHYHLCRKCSHLLP